ncbi:MAG: hypothetical protein LC754_17375 [Acidobacteria bacterium]|nr:hypothetical protein [Acidobacteriota bacterium]
MPETQHFINDGYGWACKLCRETNDVRPSHAGTLSRFFREGEAEEREPSLSFPLLARWTGDARRTLACPRCGLEEELAGDAQPG